MAEAEYIEVDKPVDPPNAVTVVDNSDLPQLRREKETFPDRDKTGRSSLEMPSRVNRSNSERWKYREVPLIQPPIHQSPEEKRYRAIPTGVIVVNGPSLSWGQVERFMDIVSRYRSGLIARASEREVGRFPELYLERFHQDEPQRPAPNMRADIEVYQAVLAVLEEARISGRLPRQREPNLQNILLWTLRQRGRMELFQDLSRRLYEGSTD